MSINIFLIYHAALNMFIVAVTPYRLVERQIIPPHRLQHIDRTREFLDRCLSEKRRNRQQFLFHIGSVLLFVFLTKIGRISSHSLFGWSGSHRVDVFTKGTHQRVKHLQFVIAFGVIGSDGGFGSFAANVAVAVLPDTVALFVSEFALVLVLKLPEFHQKCQILNGCVFVAEFREMKKQRSVTEHVGDSVNVCDRLGFALCFGLHHVFQCECWN
mmetsp:Transcript_36646/g.58716  ORF Transcript_36646/g.58716 Transcript_36646/m.58716 type:complete len:214 (-) Transcript_36646:63-704(-)